ncbi:hypothetical protein DL89DRAFT_134621 [Linderina pennispora]|uniref:Uncharacterized protein n=1 Tax=Linderina pennispora TaxID=61395 RepID=A0A1Y1WAR5_9FUNG|nr:uncharacterized protein DL89DRAFT_134621 [Linderina pennispora]ORX70465.1 hypothetical protein DL89DRAFT_134621 [Linderina pennispora]
MHCGFLGCPASSTLGIPADCVVFPQMGLVVIVDCCPNLRQADSGYRTTVGKRHVKRLHDLLPAAVAVQSSHRPSRCRRVQPMPVFPATRPDCPYPQHKIMALQRNTVLLDARWCGYGEDARSATRSPHTETAASLGQRLLLFRHVALSAPGSGTLSNEQPRAYCPSRSRSAAV